MKIMIINGSPRINSNTGNLCAFLNTITYSSDVTLINFDVSSDLLPMYRDEDEQYKHPEVARLVNMAKEADAFIICTPEYHNGISGALKNLFDFLSGSHFKGKFAQIFAVAGGGKGGINALNQLRLILRGVGAFVMPSQHILDKLTFNEYGDMENQDKEAIIHMVSDFVSIVSQNTSVCQTNCKN